MEAGLTRRSRGNSRKNAGATQKVRYFRYDKAEIAYFTISKTEISSNSARARTCVAQPVMSRLGLRGGQSPFGRPAQSMIFRTLTWRTQ